MFIWETETFDAFSPQRPMLFVLHMNCVAGITVYPTDDVVGKFRNLVTEADLQSIKISLNQADIRLFIAYVKETDSL